MKDLHELVEQFNRGEASGYKGIFDYFYKEIFYFAWKLLGNKEDAEDLSIQIFAKLFDRREHFTTVNNIRAFLFITTRNLCFNAIRDKKRLDARRQKFIATMESDYQLELEYEVMYDLMESIRQAIEQLPEMYRRLFRLLVLEERKPVEVAEILQISLDSVYQQKRRGLQLLRLWLNDKTLAISFLFYLLYVVEKKSDFFS